MSEKVPIRVVLGLDVEGKPHASRFDEHDAALVQRATELMGFRVIRVAPENDELHGIAEKLPLGKIFATGRAFVPFVNRAAFDKLATLVEAGITIEPRAPSNAELVYRPDTLTLTHSTSPTRYGPKWRSAPWCLPRSRTSMGRAGGKVSSSPSVTISSLFAGWITRN